MDTSKIVSWGSAADLPDREALRAKLIGGEFMVAYREARGGAREHKDSGWFDWVRANTPLELRWMWSSHRAFEDKDKESYVQFVGDLLFEEIAKANVSSDRWFLTNISSLFGWLFEPDCLQKDGWMHAFSWDPNGRKFTGWVRNTDRRDLKYEFSLVLRPREFGGGFRNR